MAIVWIQGIYNYGTICLALIQEHARVQQLTRHVDVIEARQKDKYHHLLHLR
jgi:hypothetical protein